MAVAPKGKAIMQLRIDEKTKEGLITLAGGERKVGRYLDELVPMLINAKGRIGLAQRRATQVTLAQMMVEQDEDEAE